MTKLRIGSRGSKLALWQAHYIKQALEQAHEGLITEIVIIKTKGDLIQDVALSKLGDKGLFIKELELALAEGSVDLCVHSMKDVPTTIPEGFDLASVPARASALDALIAPAGVTGLHDLPEGARIGTGSLRRRAQLGALKRNFEFVELRGNIDTRIQKMLDGQVDAIILAEAGLNRLGLQEHLAAVLPLEVMVPAVGQGALALELRAGDECTRELCEALASKQATHCVQAERQVMRALDGGCQVPLGAYAFIKENICYLQAVVASVSGDVILRAQAEGSPESSVSLADAVVSDLLAQGACALLDTARTEASPNAERD